LAANEGAMPANTAASKRSFLMVFMMTICSLFIDDEICVAQGKYGTNLRRPNYAFVIRQR
jgi:hypothetical protein